MCIRYSNWVDFVEFPNHFLLTMKETVHLTLSHDKLQYFLLNFLVVSAPCKSITGWDNENLNISQAKIFQLFQI